MENIRHSLKINNPSTGGAYRPLKESWYDVSPSKMYAGKELLCHYSQTPHPSFPLPGPRPSSPWGASPPPGPRGAPVAASQGPAGTRRAGLSPSWGGEGMLVEPSPFAAAIEAPLVTITSNPPPRLEGEDP